MPNDNQADDAMEAPITRRELREELAEFEERFERKLDEKLEQKLDEKLEQKLEHKFVEFEQRIVQRLSMELAQHVNAVSEQLRTEIRALGEPNKASIPEELKTLPRRVEKLEERVFAPPKRRTPTRAARRR